MCHNCEARASDPRQRAFMTVGMVELLTVKETKKVMKDDGTFDGLPPMLDVKVYQDSGVAKFESFTMMRDESLAKVEHTEVTICLN